MGGNITYVCQGGNNYLVTLDLFLDCSGVPAIDQTLHYESACGSFDVLIPPPVPTEVSQICPAQLVNSTCNGGGLQGVNLYSFQTVLNMPPCPGGWTMSWVLCCRAVTMNLVGSAGIYLEAVLRNDLAACDDSPVFTENSVPYVCVGQEASYNFGVTEPNGDSLAYSLINARGFANSSSPIGYKPGYSANQPANSTSLDPVTGQLVFTPPAIGRYVFVIEIEQYNASGVLIGTVMRDVSIVALACVGSTPVAQGSATLTGPGGPGDPPAPGGFILGPNAIQICDGSAICFSLVFEDMDPGDVLVVASQVTTLLPGATYSVSGANPATVTVCWTGDVSNSPVNVLFQVNDGACPIVNSTTIAVNITSFTPAAGSPDAGTDASTLVCPTANVFNLIDRLGGTPDAGGIWYAPDNSIHDPQFDPTTDLAGVYTYIVGNACMNVSATLTVNFTAGTPNAGVDSTLKVCGNSVPVPLISGLGGTPDATGTWTRLPGGTPVGPNYDPATQGPGVFQYTVPGGGGCAAATATVTVTEVAPANAGTSSSVSVCANGVPINLLDSLGGTPAGGGAWSGGLVGGMYNPAVNAPGPFTYTVTGTAPCANATATVTVAEQTPANAGTNGPVSVCGNGAPINLRNSLGGAPAAGGTWSGGLVGGMYDPAVNAPGPYTYTVTGVAPCANSTATVTVTEVAPADAGTSSSVSVCSNGVAINLLDSLGGTPAGGGAWSGGLVGGMYDPVVNAPGPYTYTVTGTAPCANATATVTVAEQTPVDAGTSSSVSVCSNGVAINLLDSLGGTPAGGGTWSGGLVGGMYDPAVNAPGPFTYTITGVAPCANATATVTVAEIPAAYAGSDTTFTLCSSNSTTNLFFVLTGAQAGGTWTGPGGAFFDGTYEPSVDPEGPHIYTVAGSASCADDQAVVMVVEVVAPNAGRDTSITLCSNGNILNLFTVLPTAQPGGTWLAGFSGSYEPGVTPPGVFTYSLPGIAPCVGDQSTVTIAETSTPNAGTDANLTVCDQGAAVNLFNSLGGSPDAGGTWSGGLVGGMYDPAVNAPGPYIYTVTGTSPCGNATATVTVSETGSPNAGTDGAVTVCADGAAIDLFTELGGSPDAGGTWSGGLVGGMFDPAVNAAGNYTYTLNATAPCTSDQSQVVVTIAPAPDAGTDANLTVCDQGAAVNLFNSLGGTPDAGGTWSGGLVGGMYDPAVNTPGAYTYTVTGTNPCGNATATVTVSETGSPDAGTDGAVTVCSDGSAIDLFTELGGSPDAGGSWSGGLVGGMFDPATDPAGIYTYTLSATAPCAGDQSEVEVTIAPAPNAGTDADLAVCDQGTAVDLFNSLGGTPDAGGTWSGGLVGGMYDPAVNAPGPYTYTVTGTPPCGNATATVTVSETGSPDAGMDGAVTVCADGAAIDLFTELGGSPDAGGTWSGGLVGGMFDPAVNTANTFTYTVNATAPCANATAEVVVSVEAVHDPGTNGIDTVCTGDAPINLFTLLGNGPDMGGVWTGPGGSASTGIFDPASSAQGTYTYQFAGGVCADVSSTVQMTILPGPNAGQDNAVALCDAGPSVSLLGLLSGSPQPGGSWTDPDGQPTTSLVDPATAAQGPYTYTVIGNASCPDATAVVTLAINHAVDAGTNGSLNLCSDGSPVALFGALGGTPDAGGTWTMPPNNDPFNGVLDPATNPSGNYIYTVAGMAPCPATTAQVSVVVTQAPDAGNDSTAALCSSAPNVNMQNLLGGDPDPGGSWTDPDGNNTSAIFDPGTSIPGVYHYMVPAVASCSADMASVDIDVAMAANAGGNGDTTLCSNAEPFVLMTLLSGTPDAGGIWSGPSPIGPGGILDPSTAVSGPYVYSVTAPAPCPLAISTVQVTVTAIPVVAPTFTTSQGCVPIDVTFNSGYVGNGSCFWDFGNGTDTTACGPITVTYDQPGNYIVHFTADPGNGCAVTVQTDQLVQVVERPTAAFNIVLSNTSTHSPVAAFDNLSSGAGNFLWDFGGLGTSTALDPQFTFPYDLEEIYPICLIAYASPTCADTICSDLLIPASASVFTANAFTPDGDGRNDEFAPVSFGLDPNDYHFLIVDRWGSPVYSTEDMNATWDGNFGNGTPAPIGVYVWKLTAQDMISNTRFEQIGHVTLVR